MKHNSLLTITSLVSILLVTLHVTDDIVRGLSPARADNVLGVVIFVVGGFFFVWTLLAVGVTGTFAGILSARALWVLRPGKRQQQ